MVLFSTSTNPHAFVHLTIISHACAFLVPMSLVEALHIPKSFASHGISEYQSGEVLAERRGH